MSDAITQRRATIFRRLLRAGMRASATLYPKTPAVRQAKLDGMKLLVWANEYIGRRILLTGSFEADDLARLADYASPGDAVIDVGANIGLYTLSLAKLVGPQGLVIAFEPVLRNALMVELSCELNNFQQVRQFRQPLSSRSGLVLERIEPEGDSAYSFFRERQADAGESFTSVTLDEAIESVTDRPFSFMKVDVEGGEFNVLKGGERLFSSGRRPRIVMMELVEEYLGRFGHSIYEVCAWMVERGYSLNAVRNGKLVSVAASDIEAENVFFIYAAV